MKLMIVFLTLFLSSALFAQSQPKGVDEAYMAKLQKEKEVKDVANVLIGTSDYVAQIKKQGLSIVDYKIEEVKPGVTQYSFKLDRVCNCLPLKGTMVVVEDKTPTYHDGAIKYSVDLKIGN